MRERELHLLTRDLNAWRAGKVVARLIFVGFLRQRFDSPAEKYEEV